MNILNNLPSSKIPTATQNKKGLMSSADKTKLDSIAASANNYVHPNDANTRHVTDVQIVDWDNKASKEVVSVDEDGLMSKEDKVKLNSIAENANNYVHPDDEDTRHVTDAQITAWNAKASTDVATTTTNGLMSSADKTKLDGIAANANNYVHPNDASTRHVTDAQITTWNSKLGKGVVGYTGTALALNSTSYTVSTGNIYTSVKNGSVTLANSNKALVRVYFYNASTSDNTVIGYGDFFLSATDGQSNIVPLYNGTALDFVQVTCNATVANTLTFDVKSITQNYLSRVKFTIDLFPN